MKESLYDKYVNEHGVLDFGRSGGMSQQKEAKRFLSALNKQSESQQKDCFSISVSLCYILLLRTNHIASGSKQSTYAMCRRKYIAWQIKLVYEYLTSIPS